jgi:vacuolar protein-sorting-associated protein 4
LPDVQARSRMFELNIGDTPNNLTHKDFKHLGEMTEGYSGSDIAIAVRDALMERIRKLRMATHFKPVFTPFYIEY